MALPGRHRCGAWCRQGQPPVPSPQLQRPPLAVLPLQRPASAPPALLPLCERPLSLIGRQDRTRKTRNGALQRSRGGQESFGGCWDRASFESARATPLHNPVAGLADPRNKKALGSDARAFMSRKVRPVQRSVRSPCTHGDLCHAKGAAGMRPFRRQIPGPAVRWRRWSQVLLGEIARGFTRLMTLTMRLTRFRSPPQAPAACHRVDGHSFAQPACLLRCRCRGRTCAARACRPCERCGPLKHQVAGLHIGARRRRRAPRGGRVMLSSFSLS